MYVDTRLAISKAINAYILDKIATQSVPRFEHEHSEVDNSNFDILTVAYL
jgi:hypothetical protein